MSDPIPAPASHTGAVSDLPCPDCQTPMTFRPDGKWGPWYSCPNYPTCTGAHGAHPDGAPLGKPATKAVRESRRRVHDAFDRLWKDCPRPDGLPKPRELAYRWLTARMNLAPGDCHMGQFDAELCARAETVLTGVSIERWREQLAVWAELPAEPDRRLAGGA